MFVLDNQGRKDSYSHIKDWKTATPKKINSKKLTACRELKQTKELLAIFALVYLWHLQFLLLLDRRK